MKTFYTGVAQIPDGEGGWRPIPALGSTGGTTDHRQLSETSRNAADQHPISAITNLQGTLTQQSDNIESKAGQTYVDTALAGKADKTALAKTDKRLGYLYELTRGQAWDTETDDDEAYSKSVPAGAHALSIDKIGGKTIVMNQLLNKNLFGTGGGIITNNHDGSVTANGTSTAVVVYTLNGYSRFSIPKQHKFLSTGAPSGASNNCKIMIEHYDDEGMWKSQSSDIGSGVVFTPGETVSSLSALIYISADQTINNLTFVPQLFDLTAMFGSTVAATITTPEQAYALGVPREYVEYNPGELVSADVESVISTDSDAAQIGKMEIPAAVRTQYPLRSAGSVYDTITYEPTTVDGVTVPKWYHTKMIEAIKFDGSSDENWSFGTRGTYRTAFRFYELSGRKYDSALYGLVCDKIRTQNTSENDDREITCRSVSYATPQWFYIFVPNEMEASHNLSAF